jgi:DNA-binding transcriptional LysR family regulator
VDTLASLRVFCLVAELRSFTAAAKRLDISPAMASKHLNHLERHLSARLLNRTSRSVSLTETGVLYLERALSALEELDEAKAAISDTVVNASGLLKLSAPVWMANTWFAELIRDYGRQYPLVQLEIDFSARRVNLVEEGFDLALRVTHAHHPGLIARAIAPVTFALVASREFLDRTGVPSSLDDLAGRDFLAYNSVPSDGRLTWDWPSGRRTIRLRAALRSSNETFLHLAALQGVGFAFLPEWLVMKDIRAGRLVRVLPNEAEFHGKMFAVFPSRRYLSPKVRTFLDFLATSRFVGSADVAHAPST